MSYKYYAGMQLGDLTIVKRVIDNKKTKSPNLRKRVFVECTCGTSWTIPVYYLFRKQPEPLRHCGCKNKGLPTLRKLEYTSWYMMNVRCTDENHIAYHHYGGRGIKVCERWSKDNPDGFKNFLEDVPPRPSKLFSLDRIDVNGMYEPGNVQWATAEDQVANQRHRLAPAVEGRDIQSPTPSSTTSTGIPPSGQPLSSDAEHAKEGK